MIRIGTPAFNAASPPAIGNTTPNTGQFTLLTVPNTGTGIRVFNTADQVTNYEGLNIGWVANVATIQAAFAGTGSPRVLSLVAGSTSLNIASLPTGNFIAAILSATSVAGRVGHTITGGQWTQTSGSNVFSSLTPTYNQATGTAANTDLLINRTETAIGSGAQYLIQTQVGGVNKFLVSNTGAVSIPGAAIPILTTITTATSGAGAGTGTLNNAPVSGDPTKWLAFNDAGVTRYIPAW